MEKIDLRKELKHLYSPSAKDITQIDVPLFTFLMVDGMGDPNSSQAYAEAVEALFAVSYAVKFKVRNGPQQIDYGVMPLEGLWWAEDMSVFLSGDRSTWQWTMMILQPDFVARELIEQSVEEVRRKKNPAALDRLRVESFAEGPCAQILHIGPFSAEGPTIERLHDYIDARGGRRGKHHEIYLTDIRRADPAKWKTILRQPMQ